MIMKWLPVLHDDGDFLTNYGKRFLCQEHSKAIAILRRRPAVTEYGCYTALATVISKGETGKAEQAYLHAWYVLAP